MSLNKDEPAYAQSTGYDEQVMRQQPTYANYPATHYQTEPTSQQQLPTQSIPQHLNHHQQVYSTSAPAYQIPESSSVLGTSPAYQPHLSSPNAQAPIQSLEQQPNSFPAYQGAPNYSNKVIEMPTLQSSMNMGEGMYQQLQQQKIFATSTASYNMGPSQSKNRYPWPLPKNS